MEQIDTGTADPAIVEISRILDPDDDMDKERINVQKYIVNMKYFYSKIMQLDATPEEFFLIAREKNLKLDQATKEAADAGNEDE